jgi:GDP-mannose transporter
LNVSGSISDQEKSTLVGYLWMTINCVATAGYLLYMRGRIKLLGFKDLDSMLFNNLLSIPILVVASILFEDWGSESLARNFPAEGRYFLLVAMAFSGAATVGISYTTAWCIRVTSSTTYSMVGALNSGSPLLLLSALRPSSYFPPTFRDD